MTEIKQLGPGDEALAELVLRDVKHATPDHDHAQQFLSNKMNVLLVASDGDQPVGFILAYELERADNQPNMMFFYEVEVSESHRRQGMGKALVAEFKKLCKKRKVGKMFVLTDRGNLAARALYERTGGREMCDDGVLFAYD